MAAGALITIVCTPWAHYCFDVLEWKFVERGLALVGGTKINCPAIQRATNNVECNDPRMHYIRVRAAIRIQRGIEPRPCDSTINVKLSVFLHSLEAGLGVLRQAFGQGQVGSVFPASKIGVNLRHRAGIACRHFFAPAIEAHQRHPDRRALDAPLFIAPRFKNSAMLDDRLQHLAVRAASDRIGRYHPRAPQLAVGNHRPRRRKPVADEIDPARHIWPRLSQRHGILLAQLGDHLLVAEKRRVSHDSIHVGPFRTLRFAVGSGERAASTVGHKHRVAVLDGIQRSQNRVLRRIEPVAPHPLDFADPHAHPRQFGGIGVQLDPQHAFRPHARKSARQAQRLGIQIGAMLDVLQRLQRDIQKIARSAGGIEHAEIRQPLDEARMNRRRRIDRARRLALLGRGQQPLGGPLRRAFHPRGDLRQRLGPFGLQRFDDHRPHDHHDLVAVGIMRAQLAALGGIESAFEQRAQDRRGDLAPVAPRGVQQLVDVLAVDRQHAVVGEQPAVEPVDRGEAHRAPRIGHRTKQHRGMAREPARVAPADFQHLREQLLGQQPHILGEHAEDELVDEMRDAMRLVPAVAQPLGDPGEFARGFLGQFLPRFLRPELRGIGERGLQPVAHRAVGQVVQREFVRFLNAVGPVGPDHDPVHVGYDQQRRIFQRHRILQQLGIGLVQIGVSPLIFPAEAFAPPHIGPAVAAAGLAGALFEGEPVSHGVGRYGIEHPQKCTEIVEMTLRGRAFLQLDIAPFLQEFMRCHLAPASGVRH